MTTVGRVMFLVMIGFGGTSCGGAGSQSDTPSPGNRNVLTHDEISESSQSDIYSALLALRPNWLRSRGSDSLQASTRVQVYRDDIWLGEVDVLRSVSVADVEYVRYYDGIDASGRWGLGHSQGVVYIASRTMRTAPRAFP
jgi:hypothetical protein